MSSVHCARVLLGGLLAGAVITVIEFVCSGILLMDAWADALRALNRPAAFSGVEVASFILWAFLIGISAVALYANIRDRYGAGVRTAIYAGLAIWAVAYVFPTIPTTAMHVFPRRLMAYGVIIGLVESVAATVAGAWLYRPAETRARAAAA